MECPSLAELEELLEQDGDALVSEHVASCSECRTNLSEMRANVNLAARVRSILQSAPPPDPPRGPTPALPGYRILGVSNEGAQGVVHRAIQESTKRTVAIKLLHHGAFSSNRQRRRFEREIDLVASLRHPGIVTVHESGSTPDGQLYCVMEFVDGAPIDEHVRAEGSATRQVVELFVRVCDAVHYAHQHGVLHRDLKPSNVFVDRQGEPRVLDFGLARALTSDDPEDGLRSAPLATRAGEFLGTIAYASPEQAEADPSRIDVRSDVYSLGVILFELLAGKRPYELSTNVATSVRTIQQTVPMAPSRLGAQSDRDLDTIVLRALAKDRERRYGSATDFAADLRSWLQGRPIEARRDSKLYVLRKTLQHHWIASSAIASICLVSLSAAVISNHFRGVAQVETARAEDAARRAERKAQESERVRGLLEEFITANDPERNLGREPTVREILEQAGPRIVAELIEEPLVAAALQLSIGRAYLSLHDPARAEPELQAALHAFERLQGSEHPDTLNALSSTVELRLQQARYDEAESMAFDAIARLEHAGRGQSRLAADLWGCSSSAAFGKTELPDAIERAERSLALHRSAAPPNEISYARAQAELAMLRGHHDELQPAEELMSSALETLRRHADERPALLVRTLLMAQALARLRRGYLDSARYLNEAHALCTQLYGPLDSYSLRIELAKLDAEWRARDFRVEAGEVTRAAQLEPLLVTRTDPNALEALSTLANFAASTHDLARAERLSRLVVDACERRGMARDIVLAGATDILGAAIALQGRWAEAEPVLTRALELGDALRGSEEKSAHKTAALLAMCKFQRRDGSAAESLARRAMAALKPGVTESVSLLTSESQTGQFLLWLGELELAEQVGRHALEQLRAQFGDHAPATSQAADHLAQTVRERGRLDEALELAELALTAARASPDDSKVLIANALQEIGINMRYRNHLEEAEEKLTESLDIYAEIGPPDRAYRLSALRTLGVVRLHRNDFAGAAAPLEDVVAVSRHRQPAQPQMLGELLSHLGQAYAGSERFVLADETLREAYTLLAMSYPPTDEWLSGTLDAWIAVNQELGRTEEIERLQRLRKGP